MILKFHLKRYLFLRASAAAITTFYSLNLQAQEPALPANSSTLVSAGTPRYVDPPIALKITSPHSSPVSGAGKRTSAKTNAISATGAWHTVKPAGGAILGREENSYVAAGNRFYLLGGTGLVAAQEYNPSNNTWSNKAKPPIELHHFQGVNLNGLIYAAGAMNGRFPHELPLDKVYLYNPVSNKWLSGSTIPAARRRGAAGAVAYKNKIYIVGGITDGHYEGWVNWFDEYDPYTNTWKILPNAPRVRDHFQAVVLNDKLYVAGGRRSSVVTNQTFQLTIPEVDVYDFSSGTWSTLPAASNLPVPRAGAANVILGNDILVIGGESGVQNAAHKETHALNTATNTWRKLADLNTGRHGTGAIANNGDIYIVSGAGNRGGTPLLASQEEYFVSSHSSPVGSALSQSKLSVASSIAFGSIAVNSQGTKSLTITNAGSNQDILISSITITGAASFSYSLPFPFPFAISPSKSVTIPLQFTPSTAGAQTADLVVVNSGQTGTTKTSLSGTGSGATASQKVTTFTLINSTTDTDIQTLNEGDVINLTALASKNLNIRANTNPATVGSVVFILSGQQAKTQTESKKPIALFGDDNGDYNNWTPAAGNYTLKATPYANSGGTGSAGTPLTIHFSVVNSSTNVSQSVISFNKAKAPDLP